MVELVPVPESFDFPPGDSTFDAEPNCGGGEEQLAEIDRTLSGGLVILHSQTCHESR